MKCENIFCVYEKNGNCSLNSISLGSFGECLECIYITIENEELKRLKQKEADNHAVPKT